MDADGKINGKTPVFNDILAFVYSKLKLFDISTLVGVITAYYSIEDLREARDLLYFLLDPNGYLPRLPNKCNLSCGIVFHLNDEYDDLQWIFLALDLNKIPSIDSDEEESFLFKEQHEVSLQLQQVLAEQVQVKEQLALIADQLGRIHKKEQCNITTISTQNEDQPDKPLDKQRQALRSKDSERTFSSVVQHHAPRGYTTDADGFMTKVKQPRQESGHGTGRPRSKRPMVTGVKKQGALKPTVNTIRIFATRFHPDEAEVDLQAYVSNLIDDECSVEKIQVRTNLHSSFIITANRRYEQLLLDPNSWEEGVQVRYFYGRLATLKQRGPT